MIFCPDCGQVLGERAPLAVVSLHRGREIRVYEGSIRCCKCGGEIIVRDGRPVEVASEAMAAVRA